MQWRRPEEIRKTDDVLSHTLARLSHTEDFREMILRKSGWITLSYLRFASEIVASMTNQVKRLVVLKADLIQAAKR
jgi:hypothetical protein